MITSQDKELITRLIKNYAGNRSTEKMLASIADNAGMLDVCKFLVQKNNEDDREVISWVDGQCYQKQVDLRSFLYEVQQVVSILQPGQENDVHYFTLGLEAGASGKEIKDAYRELCLRYHPDTTTLNEADAATAFIEVNKAYHALRNNDEGVRTRSVLSAPSPQWHQENKTNTVSVSKKGRNIFWFSSLTLLMIVVSILAARSYQKKAMITGLQLHQAAFIPPDSDFEVEVKETLLKDGSVLSSAKVDTEIAVNTELEDSPVEELPETGAIIQEEESVPEVYHVSSAKSIEAIPKEIATKELVVKEENPVEKNLETIFVVSNEKTLDKPEVLIVGKDNTKSKKVFDNSPLPKVTVPVATSITINEAKEPEPTAEEISSAMYTKIGRFLNNYTEAYKRKDLKTFSGFFDEYATENGKAINNVFATYVELFNAASDISLDISILKWSEKQSNIEIDGRFAIRIAYKDGKKVKGTGNISFLLKDVQPGFLIKEMTYQFDK